MGADYIETLYAEIVEKMREGKVYGLPIVAKNADFVQKSIVVAAYLLGQREEMERSIERYNKLLKE